MKTKEVKQVELEYVYGQKLTFRRSGYSKAAWKNLVLSFHITKIPPETIQSITITNSSCEGVDEFGRLRVSLIVEE